MPLTSIPLEVSEKILLFLSPEEIQMVCDVFEIDGSDLFWQKMCNRKGFKQVLGRNEMWKTVFERNMNWSKKNFLKREYIYRTSKEITLDLIGDNVSRGVLDQNSLIVKHCTGDTSVWNMEGEPTEVQSLQAQYLRLAGSKLIAYHETGITVYSNENDTYTDLLTLTFKPSPLLVSHYSLIDKFFAALEESSLYMRIVDLTLLEDYSLALPYENIKLYSFLVSGNIVYLLMEDNEYMLLRYDMQNKEWLGDICLDCELDLYIRPELRISPELIVSWSSEQGRKAITPVKVWTCSGELIKSVINEFLTFCRVNPKQILWMIVDCKYVIFSNSRKRVAIWTSLEPGTCKEIPKEKKFYKGQTVISSSFLILSYLYCFKVVDYKKAMYLYEVNFGNEELNNSFPTTSTWFANDSFYIFLQESNKDSDSDECVPEPRSNNSFLTRYDCFVKEYFYVVHQEDNLTDDVFVSRPSFSACKLYARKAFSHVHRKWHRSEALTNNLIKVCIFDFKAMTSSLDCSE